MWLQQLQVLSCLAVLIRTSVPVFRMPHALRALFPALAVQPGLVLAGDQWHGASDGVVLKSSMYASPCDGASDGVFFTISMSASASDRTCDHGSARLPLHPNVNYLLV